MCVDGHCSPVLHRVAGDGLLSADFTNPPPSSKLTDSGHDSRVRVRVFNSPCSCCQGDGAGDNPPESVSPTAVADEKANSVVSPAAAKPDGVPHMTSNSLSGLQTNHHPTASTDSQSAFTTTKSNAFVVGFHGNRGTDHTLHNGAKNKAKRDIADIILEKKMKANMMMAGKDEKEAPVFSSVAVDAQIREETKSVSGFSENPDPAETNGSPGRKETETNGSPGRKEAETNWSPGRKERGRKRKGGGERWGGLKGRCLTPEGVTVGGVTVEGVQDVVESEVRSERPPTGLGGTAEVGADAAPGSVENTADVSHVMGKGQHGHDSQNDVTEGTGNPSGLRTPPVPAASPRRGRGRRGRRSDVSGSTPGGVAGQGSADRDTGPSPVAMETGIASEVSEKETVEETESPAKSQPSPESASSSPGERALRKRTASAKKLEMLSTLVPTRRSRRTRSGDRAKPSAHESLPSENSAEPNNNMEVSAKMRDMNSSLVSTRGRRRKLRAEAEPDASA